MKPSVALGTTDSIQVRGARQHNLRNLNVDIPRDRLIVITGLSGSGKSSLAYDTIFAEGQRRYIESLSAFARHFIGELERPDVDVIEGLPPTISVAQDTTSVNPRSTVATVTEIYDHLRLLYARLGTPHCPECGIAVGRQTPEQIVSSALELGAGRKVMVLAPIIRARKGQHRDVMARILREGFVRARIDTTLCDLNHPPELDRYRPHTIEAVIDRLVIREGLRSRLADSIGLALKHGGGTVTLTHLDEDGWHDRVFSVRHACPRCERSFDELAPHSFSFNSPHGACPACGGLGVRLELDPELAIPDPRRSLGEGAVLPVRLLRGARRAELEGAIESFARSHRVRLDQPVAAMPPETLRLLLQGVDQFPGLLRLLESAWAESDDERLDAGLAPYLARTPCPECRGARLRLESRHVTVAGRAIHEVTSLTVTGARDFFGTVAFPAEWAAVARPLLAGIHSRLEFLDRVGLGYLGLDRPSNSLSGGELQRIRLAAHIGSGVIGVCYVLDEPTIGLHPRDNQRLLDALRALRDAGNTVIVIEHDEQMMRAADFLIDLGPGAGLHGGQLVAAGPTADVLAVADSLTAQYLRGERGVARPAARRRSNPEKVLRLGHVRTHNLRGIDAAFPLGTFIAVTGVSGSGKSSLVSETLAPALRRALATPPADLFSARGRAAAEPQGRSDDRLLGAEHVDKLIEIDQSPIGRSARSTPATYVGVLDDIRRIFAGTREAKLRGYKTSRFSPNTRGGRCPVCEGLGMRKIAMSFLPDLHVTCEACQGRRYNPQTLAILYRGRSIADVLGMRVDEALAFFDNFPMLARRLSALADVGLSYITLGQPATTLSGGEAQRIKLAAELCRVATGRTVYVLDEPTTGLHFADVENLLRVLHRLVDLGNTVIIIEHHLDVIKTADFVIDLGPGGGNEGGSIVCAGAPEQVAACEASATGRFLRGVL